MDRPGVCQQVSLPRLTRPPEIAALDRDVNSGYFQYELRAAGETKLYLTVVAFGVGKNYWPAREKYSVDLSQPKRVRRIDETVWKSAPPLQRGNNVLYPPRPEEPGIRYNDKVLEKSGPKWGGFGPYVRSSLSVTKTRAAVNSWDGIDDVSSFLDPTSFGHKDKVEGQYWIDIYDLAAGQRLLTIRGSFKGVEPSIFQGAHAAWYSDRYYVLPVGGTLPGSFELSMRRLLICDLDAASRQDNPVLQERK